VIVVEVLRNIFIHTKPFLILKKHCLAYNIPSYTVYISGTLCSYSTEFYWKGFNKKENKHKKRHISQHKI